MLFAFFTAAEREENHHVGMCVVLVPRAARGAPKEQTKPENYCKIINERKT
jgi:hypothetical protein